MSAFLDKTANMTEAEWLAITEGFVSSLDESWYERDEDGKIQATSDKNKNLINQALAEYIKNFDPNNIDLSSISTYNS
jgi:hypothetical protein